MRRLPDIAAGGDERATLSALRQIIAERIDETTSARDTASLVARMQAVLERIAELDGKEPKKVSAVDELAARRRTRRTPVRDGKAAKGARG